MDPPDYSWRKRSWWETKTNESGAKLRSAWASKAEALKHKESERASGRAVSPMQPKRETTTDVVFRVILLLSLLGVGCAWAISSCKDRLDSRRREKAEQEAERSRPPPGYMVPVTVLNDGLDKPREKPCVPRNLDVLLEGKSVSIDEFSLRGIGESFAFASIDNNVRVIPRHGARVVAENKETAVLEAGGKRTIVLKKNYYTAPSVKFPDECNPFMAPKPDEIQKKYREAATGFRKGSTIPERRKPLRQKR